MRRRTYNWNLNRLLVWLFPESDRWSRLSLFSLLMGFWIAMAILPSGYDLPVYILPALRGENVQFPYPLWALWLLRPLLWIPFKANYILLVGLIIGALATARRWSRGDPWKLFLSFPFVWVLWYGQFDAFVSAGAILGWMAVRRENPLWAGVALALLSVKPNIGLPAALAILWWLPTWRSRLLAALPPAGLVLASLVVFDPTWPVAYFEKLDLWLDYYTNGSLYWWIGPWAYMLFIPALALPLPRPERYRMILATTLLTVPFVPNYSQLVLYLFPLSWIQWALGYLPVSQIWWGETVHRFSFLFPLSVALELYWCASRGLWQRMKNEDGDARAG